MLNPMHVPSWFLGSLDHHLQGSKMLWVLSRKPNARTRNPETYLKEIVRKHNFICFVIIKTRQMAFEPIISTFLMMTKHIELLQINKKETSSEASPKHMHITNVSYK